MSVQPAIFSSLEQWLVWQESLHPSSIDLGLERVAAVWRLLQPQGLHSYVITVGGTNGKGSCVAMLGAILRTAGYRVGMYTSPHLLRYNERINIHGNPVSDGALCAAFARIEQARTNISLTYFEFGTLAALDLFGYAKLDVVILEVGLGGRLDAVNIIEPNLTLITTVDLDHTEWLGPDLEAIAREKAGIFRNGCPAIIGDVKPPNNLAKIAKEVGAPVFQAGKDFHAKVYTDKWEWRGPTSSILDLPQPTLKSGKQVANAAAVLMLLDCAKQQLPVDAEAIRKGLTSVDLVGRLQVIPGAMTWILDVAHNPQAMANLAQDLAIMPASGPTHAIFACLADKNALDMVKVLAPQIDHWHLIPLLGPRSVPTAVLAQTLISAGIKNPVTQHVSAIDAVTSVLEYAQNKERVVVTGSFLTVAAVLKQIQPEDKDLATRGC
ncbi:hypothetical protein TI04_04160 [Achromatium sp. WMS2]|nr:hypothetical protein TI04_04160 [Achromatium sp. WMS2]